MNVLFSSTATIECSDGCFYNNSICATLPRYYILGEHITCLAFSQNVLSPKQEKIKDENVDFVFVKKINTLTSLFRRRAENRILIENEVKKADICVIHVPSFIGESVVQLARKYKKPYITVVVGCAWDSYWNYSLKGKMIAPFRYWSLRKVQKDSPYSIYVTNEFLQRRYPTNGISIACSNVNIATGDERILKRRLQRIFMRTRPLKMATIAAVNVRYKGQEYVIEALSKLRDKGIFLEYHLIGSGSTDFLQSLVLKHNLQDRVFFHGAVPHEQILSILDDIDIYIQPSKQEGLPRALIEAMSRGCLCLGSATAGIPELLDSNYVFRRGNVNDIVKILSEVKQSDFESQAKRNFLEASKYDSKILNEKRSYFLKEVAREKLL